MMRIKHIVIIVCILIILIANSCKPMPATDALPTNTVALPTETQKPTHEPVANPTSSATVETKESLELDLTRGELITDEITAEVAQPDQKKVVNDIEVSISRVIRKGTRAYIKLCIRPLTPSEPYRFGTFWLDYPGGQSINSIVHNETPGEDGSNCSTIELVSIPSSTPLQGWKFTMKSISFLAPQEGTECDVYLKRAQANEALNTPAKKERAIHRSA